MAWRTSERTESGQASQQPMLSRRASPLPSPNGRALHATSHIAEGTKGLINQSSSFDDICIPQANKINVGFYIHINLIISLINL